MTKYEWVTILAIILGPILALWVQRILDGIRDGSNQRRRLFLALMASRATPLSPNHVNALNAIDSVFHGWRYQRVRDAWKRAIDHINLNPNPADIQAWADRLYDLRVDLYQVMGKAVGYTYTTDYLKRQFYLPRLFTDAETESLVIRQTLAKILTDDGLKVRIVPEPPVAAPAAPAPPPPPAL